MAFGLTSPGQGTGLHVKDCLWDEQLTMVVQLRSQVAAALFGSQVSYISESSLAKALLQRIAHSGFFASVRKFVRRITI